MASHEQTAESPLARFVSLFDRAAHEGPFDHTAATLATAAPGGQPSARVVLVRGVDERGFTFFTNYRSRKARELDANPLAALCFYWPWIDAQVRAEGRVERVSAEESDAYFATRPRGSQIGAWASEQSERLGSRGELEQRYADVERKYHGSRVPRPPHWGGFRLRPDRIEFWKAGTFRLHDRTLYTREGDRWTVQLLNP
jgi:pyridoxamine 5'-phosphate oxidase